jgi:hypothetical protein
MVTGTPAMAMAMAMAMVMVMAMAMAMAGDAMTDLSFGGVWIPS